MLARYRKRYAGKDAMGTLTLEPLNVRDLWGPEVSALATPSPATSTRCRWSRAGRWSGPVSPKATGLTMMRLPPRRREVVGGGGRVVLSVSEQGVRACGRLGGSASEAWPKA